MNKSFITMADRLGYFIELRFAYGYHSSYGASVQRRRFRVLPEQGLELNVCKNLSGV